MQTSELHELLTLLREHGVEQFSNGEISVRLRAKVEQSEPAKSASPHAPEPPHPLQDKFSRLPEHYQRLYKLSTVID